MPRYSYDRSNDPMDEAEVQEMLAKLDSSPKVTDR